MGLGDGGQPPTNPRTNRQTQRHASTSPSSSCIPLCLCVPHSQQSRRSFTHAQATSKSLFAERSAVAVRLTVAPQHTAEKQARRMMKQQQQQQQQLSRLAAAAATAAAALTISSSSSSSSSIHCRHRCSLFLDAPPACRRHSVRPLRAWFAAGRSPSIIQ